MADVTRTIGLSLGADICWPICYEQIVGKLKLSIPWQGDQVGVEVEPVVDLQARHHQGVSRTKGSDGQERHSLFVGMNEATG